jgi:hypothetical protein
MKEFHLDLIRQNLVGNNLQVDLEEKVHLELM